MHEMSRGYGVENVKSLKRGFEDHEKAQELLERIAKEVGSRLSRKKKKTKRTSSSGETVDVQTQMEGETFDGIESKEKFKRIRIEYE